MLRLLTLLLILPIDTKATLISDHNLAAGLPITKIQEMIEDVQSYIVYEGEQGMLINKNEFIVFPIKTEEIRKSIDLIKKEHLQFRKNPINHRPELFEIEMEKLYISLIQPIGIKLQKSIHIIPSPLLSSIPWNALKNENGNYLIDKHTITLKQQISDYQKSTNRKIKTLVFAPEFSGSTYLNSKLEKSMITKLFRETENEISNYDIIHISSHGRIDSSNWLDSGIYMNDENILKNREIVGLCINASLVFLNICKGGEANKIGKSIVTAFQEAGAQTVIAAIWEIDDQVAIKISRPFYEKIAQGEKPSEALQSALLAYRKKVELNSELNPFYWSGYQVYGENKAIIEELSYNIKRIMSLILSFLTSFSLIGYYYGGKIKGKLIEFNLA